MEKTMTPNFCAPVDRSPEAMQGIKHRGDVQAFSGNVAGSGIACTLCMAAANALPFPADIAAKAACNATVC
jgi:hypothetical protein